MPQSVQHGVGIQAGIPACQELLQPLIDHLAISFCEFRSDLLGGDRVPQGLDQFQTLRQGQGQQVIHHAPCRQGRRDQFITR